MTTKGDIYAGINENGIEDNEIEQLRGAVATIVDNLEYINQYNPHVNRLVLAAQAKFEEACMLAVKAYYLSKE